MENKIVSLEVAILAKEQGFSIEQPHGYYDSIYGREDGLSLNEERYVGCQEPIYQAPNQTFLRNWLLMEKNVHIELSFDNMTWAVHVGEFTTPDFFSDLTVYLEESHSIEEAKKDFTNALELGLLHALKLIS